MALLNLFYYFFEYERNKANIALIKINLEKKHSSIKEAQDPSKIRKSLSEDIKVLQDISFNSFIEDSQIETDLIKAYRSLEFILTEIGQKERFIAQFKELKDQFKGTSKQPSSEPAIVEESINLITLINRSMNNARKEANNLFLTSLAFKKDFEEFKKSFMAFLNDEKAPLRARIFMNTLVLNLKNSELEDSRGVFQFFLGKDDRVLKESIELFKLFMDANNNPFEDDFLIAPKLFLTSLQMGKIDTAKDFVDYLFSKFSADLQDEQRQETIFQLDIYLIDMIKSSIKFKSYDLAVEIIEKIENKEKKVYRDFLKELVKKPASAKKAKEIIATLPADDAISDNLDILEDFDGKIDLLSERLLNANRYITSKEDVRALILEVLQVLSVNGEKRVQYFIRLNALRNNFIKFIKDPSSPLYLDDTENGLNVTLNVNREQIFRSIVEELLRARKLDLFYTAAEFIKPLKLRVTKKMMTISLDSAFYSLLENKKFQEADRFAKWVLDFIPTLQESLPAEDRSFDPLFNNLVRRSIKYKQLDLAVELIEKLGRQEKFQYELKIIFKRYIENKELEKAGHVKDLLSQITEYQEEKLQKLEAFYKSCQATWMPAFLISIIYSVYYSLYPVFNKKRASVEAEMQPQEVTA